jgi:hypothetical protein
VPNSLLLWNWLSSSEQLIPSLLPSFLSIANQLAYKPNIENYILGEVYVSSHMSRTKNALFFRIFLCPNAEYQNAK